MTSVLIAALLVAPAFSAGARSQDLQGRLDSTVEEYSLASPSLVHALHKLATDFKLPIGVEWVRDNDSMKPVRLSWRGARLKTIIEAVVAAYPRYSVSAQGTIVHVFHAGVRNNPADALSVRLGAVDIKNERLDVASGFRVRSRVRRALQPELSAQGEAGSIASGAEGDRRVNVTSANPAVRDVLDMLVVSAGEMIWVVTYPPRGKAEGRWQQTVTLGGHPVSSQHQPHWTFLPWGPPSLVKVSGRVPGPVKR